MDWRCQGFKFAVLRESCLLKHRLQPPKSEAESRGSRIQSLNL